MFQLQTVEANQWVKSKCHAVSGVYLPNDVKNDCCVMSLNSTEADYLCIIKPTCKRTGNVTGTLFWAKRRSPADAITKQALDALCPYKKQSQGSTHENTYKKKIQAMKRHKSNLIL